MDPLSITVAITTLTTTVASIVTYVQNYTNAPAHIAKLLQNIQHFTHELEILSRQFGNPQLARHLPQEHINEVSAEAQRIIKELHSTLRRVTGEDDKQPDVRRLTWLRYEKKCQELQSLLVENLEKLTRLKNLVTVSVVPFIERLAK